MNEKAPKESKFKHTRELVRIALNEGMTQSDIARVCRTQQSVVSHWADGSSKARQSQVAPLIQRFGHKLNRSTSRVYYVEDPPDPEVRWEDTERAQKLLAHKKREAKAGDRRDTLDALKSLQPEVEQWFGATQGDQCWTIEKLIQVDQDDFRRRPLPWRPVVVEGPIIFRHTFTFPTVVERGNQNHLVLEPIERLLVHLASPARFVAVWQRRRLLAGPSFRAWRQRVGTAGGPSHADWVFAHDDAGRWRSKIGPAMELPEVLEHTDRWLAANVQLFSPHDRATAPFLLRKALIERGFDVPGVERIVPQL